MRLISMSTISSAAIAVASFMVVSVASAAPSLPDWRSLPDWSGNWLPGPNEGNVLDVKGGSSADADGARSFPPYNATWEAKYVRDLANDIRGRDPGSACLRVGVPRNMAIFYSMEFVVSPSQTVILLEYPWNFRQIFTDGRKPPADADRTPNGFSTGHWEGDTLVVETVNFRNDTWFDRTGGTHSDQMRIVERFRKVSPDLMEDKMTIYDPVAFSHPWELRRTYRRDPNGRMLEYNCAENNRNPVDADGKNLVILNKSLAGAPP